MNKEGQGKKTEIGEWKYKHVFKGSLPSWSAFFPPVFAVIIPHFLHCIEMADLGYMFPLVPVMRVNQKNLFQWKKFNFTSKQQWWFLFLLSVLQQKTAALFNKLLAARGINSLSKVWQMNSHPMKYDTFQRAWKQLIDFQENAEN